MRHIHLSGSPGAMGEAFGEACRHEIAELLALRVENALRDAREHGAGRPPCREDLLRLAAACHEVHARFHPAGAEELQGIARGAGLPLPEVVAMNGLTDLRDGLAWGGALEAAGGCTGFLVAADAAADRRPRLGQTWDLATDNAPFVVVVHRRPARGPATRCVTTVGCLSLIGTNEHGLAVGTTNLRTSDAGVGVHYLGLLHRALHESEADAAAEVIRTAPRAGAHAYLLLDARGAARALECTGRRARVKRVDSGFHVQTNHCQVPEHAELEVDVPRASSHARHARLTELLAARAGSLDDASLAACLADEEGGQLAIRRVDFDGISTNAAAILCPSRRGFEACAGPPAAGSWEEIAPAA